MGYDMYFENGGGTFRLNMHGMHAWALPHMDDMGMIVDMEPEIPYPRDLRDAAEATPEDSAEWEAFSASLKAWQAQGVEAPGIPVFKLTSNDDWLVTPSECTSAIERYVKRGAKPAESSPDLWQRWITFITVAAACGGFRVN